MEFTQTETKAHEKMTQRTTKPIKPTPTLSLARVSPAGSFCASSTTSKSSGPNHSAKTYQNSSKYCGGYMAKELIKSAKSGDLSLFERRLAGGAHVNYCEEKVFSHMFPYAVTPAHLFRATRGAC